MFSGIVEDLGTVVDWCETNVGWVLKIQPDHPELFLNKEAFTYIGASISVSGVCLTVTAFDSSVLEFGVAPETIRRTNFGKFEKGKSRVNLERATPVNGRNSGHYVQGHVDCTGKILNKWEENESLWFKIGVPENMIDKVIEKGFIAVEGTSLTVCDVSYERNPWFTLMLIDHTQKHVNIPLKQIGDTVNLEFDVLVKYLVSLKSKTEEETREKIRSLEERVQRLENKLLTAKL